MRKVHAIQIGDRFHQLEVIGTREMIQIKEGPRSHYRCRCHRCGGTAMILAKDLITDNKKSCGCAHEKHGHHLETDRLYRIWSGMNGRCNSESHVRFAHYGGRGIKPCLAWRRYANFRDWAMTNGYQEELTLERKDVDQGYCPENCTWIPREDQIKNKQFMVMLEAFGETKRLADWARDERCMVDYYTLYSRLKIGFSPEEALTIAKNNHRVRS